MYAVLLRGPARSEISAQTRWTASTGLSQFARLYEFCAAIKRRNNTCIVVSCSGTVARAPHNSRHRERKKQEPPMLRSGALREWLPGLSLIGGFSPGARLLVDTLSLEILVYVREVQASNTIILIRLVSVAVLRAASCCAVVVGVAGLRYRQIVLSD